FPHCIRLSAFGVGGPQGRGWVERIDGAPRDRRDEGGLPAWGVDALVALHGRAESQPDGDGVVWPGDGLGFRVVVRLLVYGLSRGAAGDGGWVDDCRAPHALDRGGPEDAHAAACDSAGHARDRAARVARGIPADRERRTAELQPRHSHDARAFMPTGLLGLGLTALMASFMSGMAG